LLELLSQVRLRLRLLGLAMFFHYLSLRFGFHRSFLRRGHGRQQRLRDKPIKDWQRAVGSMVLRKLIDGWRWCNNGTGALHIVIAELPIVADLSDDRRCLCLLHR
jgi:hypothetical protein